MPRQIVGYFDVLELQSFLLWAEEIQKNFPNDVIKEEFIDALNEELTEREGTQHER